VRGGENPCTGAVIPGGQGELEHPGNYNGRDWELENWEALIAKERNDSP
jgi:hypothetical protein